jgi:aconitate hydratase 2/2-methylisocitrate dehydratase
MPLDMPESVLVRFKGKMQPGVTLRDLVNAIPLYAIKQGLLTVAKQGKKNIFSGRILEIEGLPDLKVEQASNCPTPRPSVRPPVARCA